MSENSTETTASTPTPSAPSRVETNKTPETAYAVFENGDQEVTGNGVVTPEMRAQSWNNGYGVIQSKKNGDWKTSLRETE